MKDRGRYAFAISPIGKGLDCHRTWESLILGQIVIVQTTLLITCTRFAVVIVITGMK